MKLLKLATLVLVFSLLVHASENPEQGVRNRLIEIAGKNAINCGRAANGSEYVARSRCALSAYKGKSPFFVQYSVIGTDALEEEGVARDSQGRLFHVWTISNSPLYGGKPSGKFETHLCDTNSLRKLSDGELTCNFVPE